MGTTLKEEFTWRRFGTGCAQEENDLFVRSQWFVSRGWFLFYRAFIWTYQLGWTIAFLVWTGVNSPRRLGKNHRYLTSWGDMINVLYFTFAFFLCCLYARRPRDEETGPNRCLRSIVWILHTVAVNSSVAVTVLYWGILAPSLPIERRQSPFSIHGHAMNTVLILIDFFMIATPVRPLHCVYASLYGLVYTFATLCIHWSGETSAVYPFLDWADKPARAVGIALALAVISPVFIQFLFYGLYRIKLKASDSCNLRRDSQKVKIHTVYTAPDV